MQYVSSEQYITQYTAYYTALALMLLHASHIIASRDKVHSIKKHFGARSLHRGTITICVLVRCHFVQHVN